MKDKRVKVKDVYMFAKQIGREFRKMGWKGLDGLNASLYRAMKAYTFESFDEEGLFALGFKNGFME